MCTLNHQSSELIWSEAGGSRLSNQDPNNLLFFVTEIIISKWQVYTAYLLNNNNAVIKESIVCARLTATPCHHYMCY